MFLFFFYKDYNVRNFIQFSTLFLFKKTKEEKQIKHLRSLNIGIHLKYFFFVFQEESTTINKVLVIKEIYILLNSLFPLSQNLPILLI